MSKLQGEVLTPKTLIGSIGFKGGDGATFIPFVSADGIISWTNDKDLPNPDPVNIKGEKGDKGDPGEKGEQGETGATGPQGEPGKAYVLTPEDIAEIAEIAAGLVEVPDSGGNVDLTGYATEKYVKEYAQPKGDYLTEVPSGYATEEFVKNKIAEAELGGEEVDLSGYAKKSELPTKVSQLENDRGYLTEHQDISGKLDSSALPTAINAALAQAKASGEFDGADGAKGDKGDTGEKGDPGKDGVNGVTPHVGSNGNWFIGDNDTGIPATGPAGGQGLPGTPGEDGKDGTSATHSWSGTVLTITSASGTSSADLKGEPGKDGYTPQKGVDYFDGAPGKDGTNGKDGQNGYTPVRGVDYWTEADKAEIISSLCAVLYTEQELTEEQQAQARANIGASAIKVNLNNGVLSIE